jgi:hypothetical protein
MPEHKKQHFVPRFYLKYFSNNNLGKAIEIYNLKNNKYITDGNLKNQAYKDYFYGKDGNVEDILKDLETDASIIISFILKNKYLPSHGTKAHVILLVFVIIFIARTEYSVEAMNEMLDKQIKTIFRNDPRAKDFIDEISIEFENPAAFSLSMISGIIPVTYDLCFKLFINNTKTRFISSDNPVVKYNKFLEMRKKFGSNVGLSTKGLQLMLPLNPNIYLIFYDAWVYKVGPKKQQIIVITEDRDIDELNKLQVVNAKENLYFDNLVTEDYIEKIVSSGKKYIRNRKVNVEEYKFETSASINEGLVHVYDEDVRTGMSLTFISETKKAKRYNVGNKVVHIRNEKLNEMVREMNKEDLEYNSE